jgi:hypothetical protein
MYLAGCAYNFSWEHDSLRVAAEPGGRLKWSERTPAMVAGLTGHRWTTQDPSEGGPSMIRPTRPGPDSGARPRPVHVGL